MVFATQSSLNKTNPARATFAERTGSAMTNSITESSARAELQAHAQLIPPCNTSFIIALVRFTASKRQGKARQGKARQGKARQDARLRPADGLPAARPGGLRAALRMHAWPAQRACGLLRWRHARRRALHAAQQCTGALFAADEHMAQQAHCHARTACPPRYLAHCTADRARITQRRRTSSRSSTS